MSMTPPPSPESTLNVQSVNPDGTWAGVTWVPAGRTEYEAGPADLNDRSLAYVAMALGLALLAVAGAFVLAGVLR